MRLPCAWLAEWVEVPWSARELGSRLTMAGLEFEGLEAAAPDFTGVVVGEILTAEKHPQADKLRVCRVSSGAGEPLTIVCGAPNARAGLKSALAVVGATLPGNLRIGAAKLRGVESAGMLCSARELGLAEAASGILELPPDAPTGMNLREYLDLEDAVLVLNITPNRGDAMSVIGIAREVAALSGEPLTAERPRATPGLRAAGASRPVGSHGSSARETLPVRLEAPAACPKLVGCVVRGIDNQGAPPIWMRERLRRAGLRSISPVVDVTNYVMLELGQPMHAYDLGKLEGEVCARFARPGESITLLDGRTVQVQPDVLLIADAGGPIGIAGVMGGERTATGPATTDVFLEVAYFSPEAIIGKPLRFGLTTDASQRFERGVDPSQQERALERALELLESIAGGRPGPVTVARSEEHMPRRPTVSLRRTQLARLLGLELADERVRSTLHALGMRVEASGEGWRVTPPPHRFDIAIEADLIEEVARIVGYEAIVERDAPVAQRFHRLPESRPGEQALLETLAMRGYQEAISYAFVDPALQSRLFPDRPALALSNPIASDLSVMRVSLWPGLIKAALENQRRQQSRIRLFERGACFIEEQGATREADTLSGIVCGSRLPEQWGIPAEQRVAADFFDAKGDLEALLAGITRREAFAFEAAELACLHPGRSARVLRSGNPVGWLGELHPALVKELDFTYAPILFELEAASALGIERPAFREVSRFPQVRRDLAVVLDESVPLSHLTERVTLSGSSLLRDLRVFDVYRGPGVEEGRKSVALGLIFQDISRTLTDDDVARAVASVVADLRVSLNARIRE
jgi:phenylalanyl-tRNA synthetase beta chain